MVAGQLNNKIGFVIQARIGSSRFPGKTLMPIPLHDGKPLLKWIVDQLKLSNTKSEIIVATTDNETDQVICDFCQNHSIKYYQGQEDDVLSRFVAVTKLNSYDTIVRFTGDNPLLDIGLVDNTIEYHINNQNDYTCTKGLPIGMNIEVISGKILVNNYNIDLSKEEKEHVTLNIVRNDNFNKGVYTYDLNEKFKNLRLTVDYPSDFVLFNTIMPFYRKESRNGLGLVKFIMEKFPWVFETNVDNVQKKQYDNLEEELKAASKLLKKLDMDKVASILNSPLVLDEKQ